MKAERKYIHPIYGVRSLRLSETIARSYGYAPYDEPTPIITDDEPAIYPKPSQPQAPESPKPSQPNPAPVTTQKRKPGRKPKKQINE